MKVSFENRGTEKIIILISDDQAEMGVMCTLHKELKKVFPPQRLRYVPALPGVPFDEKTVIEISISESTVQTETSRGSEGGASVEAYETAGKF